MLGGGGMGDMWSLLVQYLHLYLISTGVVDVFISILTSDPSRLKV